MKTQLAAMVPLVLLLCQAHFTYAQTTTALLSEQLEVLSRESQISLSQEEFLRIVEIAQEVSEVYGSEGGIDIAFVDYDNSTISQMAEVWMKIALLHYGIEGIRIHSLGLSPDEVHQPALRTFERWGFKLRKDQNSPEPMLTLDYGSGSWNLFAKGIEPSEVNDLVLYVDEHCATHLYEKELSALHSISFVLGTSPDCLDQSETEYARINGSIGVRMFRLAERIEALLLEKHKIGKNDFNTVYFN